MEPWKSEGAAVRVTRRSGPQKVEQLPGRLDSKSTPSKTDLQGRRAAWLARRYRLAPTMAAAVAALHFGEVRA